MASSELPETANPEHKISVGNHDYNTNSSKVERLQRAQWLRAAILGANDGLVSTTALMLGVGAVGEDGRSIVLSGLAGALAGACSMALGEFVSVSTQRDIEKAIRMGENNLNVNDARNAHKKMLDLTTTTTTPPSSSIKEIKASSTTKKTEDSLSAASPNMNMVVQKNCPLGMSPKTSPVTEVVKEDAHGGYAISLQKQVDREEIPTNPYKAAAASALAFLCGSLVPLISAILVTQNVIRIVVIAVATSIALLLFGGLGAHLGGSPIRISATRVLVGGWIAMAITFGLLKPFDGYEHKESSDAN